ncbi:uncharacterized protein LOC111711081 [Eurytemora carolleeae]|uniref:uncharacterized protein LOC111711081 n=1 Tax=Eurytemora carolleeae TaxID=1294199 RepID=UPI000C780446|nr:uncharacterized protein LOC111711081 [Eurytemora carolleeae]|eukprot:XP_023341098.1 uncharacterized protein LOC111711081 [Eurytemora affinis]
MNYAWCREMNMLEPPSRISCNLILGMHCILWAGILLRILAIVYSGQLQILDFNSLVRIMSGDTIPEKDRLSARLVHVILFIVTCQGILPHVYVLAMTRENSSIWQFIILILVLAVIVYNHVIIFITRKIVVQQPPTQEEMNLLVEVVSRIESMVNRTTQEEEEGEDRHIGPILHHQENCEKTRLCFHSSFAYMSNIYLFIPLVITLVRTLFTLRMRKWILKIQFVGPFLSFITSTRIRDYSFFVFQVFVVGVSISGMTHFSEKTIDEYIEKDENSLFFVLSYILLDTRETFFFIFHNLNANLLSVLGLISIFGLYIRYHNLYCQGKNVVSAYRLKTNINKFIEAHRNVLEIDNKPSKNKYHPITCGVQPVISGQRICSFDTEE